MPFVWITQALEAKHYALPRPASRTPTIRGRRSPRATGSTPTATSWAGITHPSLDFSLAPRFVHPPALLRPAAPGGLRRRPDQPVALLPVARRRPGTGERLLLTADRADRVAAARLVNDLEKLPNPEGGGWNLSPRLEAELIKMLTRPTHSPVASPGEAPDRRGLGMLGVPRRAGRGPVRLALPAQGRIQEQNDSFLALARSVEQLATTSAGVDTLLQKVGGRNRPISSSSTTRPPRTATDDHQVREPTLDLEHSAAGPRTSGRVAEQAAKLADTQKSLAAENTTPRRLPSSAGRSRASMESNDASSASDELAPGSNRPTARKHSTFQRERSTPGAREWPSISTGGCTALFGLQHSSPPSTTTQAADRGPRRARPYPRTATATTHQDRLGPLCDHRGRSPDSSIPDSRSGTRTLD